ncbi:hypothetical protein ABZ517_29300 [Streptomyces scabiei]|uniref:hypothetical protein n=1 Tax=Streptomyces scabiei TaxID=1930 RepID=UPI0033F20B8D
MIDIRSWVLQAERIHEDDEYTYVDLARDLAARLGWTAALDVATALRGYVYGQVGRSELHTAVRPIYEALGWQQAALVACWFRDARNRPGRRPGDWPGPTPSPSTPERSETS